MRFPNNDTFYVDIQTGYFYYRTTDLSVPSHGLNIQLKRHFNSKWYYDSVNNGVYDGWYFSFDEHLYIDPYDESVMIRFPQGYALRFEYDEDSDSYSPTTTDNTLQLERISVIDEYQYIVRFMSGIKHYFDNNGELIKEENTIGNCITYVRSDSNQRGPRGLSKIIGPCGREINVQFNIIPNNDELIFTDWTGRTYTYIYTNNSIASYTDPDGNKVTYNYPVGMGGFASITYPLEGEYMTLEALGPSPSATKIKKITFAKGLIVDYTYDWITGQRTMTQTFEDESRTWNYEYNEKTFFRESKTDPLGNITTYTHDSLGRTLTRTNSQTGTTTYTYDSKGNILTITDALGNTRTYEYNDSNWPDKVTKAIGPYPDNFETTFTYDSTSGNLVTSIDPLGRTITNTYYSGGTKDSLLCTTNDFMGRTTEYDYDDFGNVKWKKDWQNRYEYFTYDEGGKLHKHTDVFGQVFKNTFDSRDNLITMEDDDGRITRLEYDSCNRYVKSKDYKDRVVLYVYDSFGRLESSSDSQGNTTVYEYDEYRRIIKKTDSAGFSVEYEYDIFDNITSITDKLERKLLFEYDFTSGRLEKMTDPLGRITEYSVDTGCSFNSITDPKGNVTKYYNNALCQLTQVEHADGSLIVFDYDEEGRKIRATTGGYLYGSNIYAGGEEYSGGDYGDIVYGKGDFTYGYVPGNVVKYEYDASNRLTKISRPDPLRSEFRKDIAFEYNNDDGIKTITDAGGMTATHTYDTYDRISSIKKHNQTLTYSYDDSEGGRIEYMLLPNGIKKEYEYNSDDELVTVKYTKDSGSTVLYQFDYVYGDDGNIIKRTVTDPDGVETLYEYSYDSLDRLVNVRKNGSENTSYEFDAVGNRLAKSKDGSSHNEEKSTYNACDELKTMDDVMFEFDLNGNMTKRIDPSDGTTEYHYNCSNRLVRITHPDGTESTFEYDAAGLRTKRIDKTGKVTFFCWDDVNIDSIPDSINWFDEDGNVILTQFPNIGFQSEENNDEWRFFITDHLGTVIALTDEDGEITDCYEYDEYGIPLSESGTSHNPFRYVGQEWDEDSKLLYLRARFYDPELGRFISRDPDENQIETNLYAYAGGNPIIFVDLSGHRKIKPYPNSVKVEKRGNLIGYVQELEIDFDKSTGEITWKKLVYNSKSALITTTLHFYCLDDDGKEVYLGSKPYTLPIPLNQDGVSGDVIHQDIKYNVPKYASGTNLLVKANCTVGSSTSRAVLITTF